MTTTVDKQAAVQDHGEKLPQPSAGVTGTLWRGAEVAWRELAGHPVRSLALTGAAILMFGPEPLAAVAAVAAISAAHALDQRRKPHPA